MIVDYHWGLQANLDKNQDPRFLLVKGEKSGGSTDEWSLGNRGWIILGFDNGFEVGHDKCIRFTENHTGEWCYVWVAGADVDEKHPLVYTDANDNFYLNYQIPTRYGAASPYQAGGGEIYYHPDWLHPGWGDKHNDKSWYFVGAVKGSGAGVNANGPHLGFIPQKKYFYILALDAGDLLNSDAPNTGPDMSQIGVFNVVAEEGKNYHFILIDDSGSVNSTEEVKWMEEEIKTAIEKAVAFNGTNYIVIRYLREAKDFETLSSRTARATFYYTEPDPANPGKEIYEKTEMLEVQSKSATIETDLGKKEIVQKHLIINGVDKGVILTEADEKNNVTIGDKILKMIRIRFEIKDGKDTKVFLPKFQGHSTPILDALRDTYDDIKGLPLGKKQIMVSMVSDGLSDPGGQPSWVDPTSLNSTEKDTVLAEINGDIRTVLINIKGEIAKQTNNNVVLQMEVMSTSNIAAPKKKDFKILDEYKKALKDYQDNVLWLKDTYMNLTDNSGEKIFVYMEAEGEIEIKPEYTVLDHKKIPHTDCINTITPIIVEKEEGLVKKKIISNWQEYKYHRISPGEAKRYTFEPGGLALVKMPECHKEIKPVLQPDGTTKKILEPEVVERTFNDDTNQGFYNSNSLPHPR